MNKLTLARGGQPVVVGRQGPTFVVINHAAVDYAVNPGTASPGQSGYVLVGFDRLPLLSRYDAIVPPWSRAVIYVPEGVSQVELVFPSDARAKTNANSTDTLPLLVDWLPCIEVPTIEPIGGTFLDGAGLGTFRDNSGNLILGGPPPLLVLDQNNSADPSSVQRFRPVIGPSVLDPIHVAATGVNALFDFAGPNDGLHNLGGAGDLASKVLKALFVSVSVATLFVLGTRGMAVGNGDLHEAVRALLPAGTMTPFYFAEGYEINRGNVGRWQAYTAVSGVLDATVMTG